MCNVVFEQNNFRNSFHFFFRLSSEISTKVSKDESVIENVSVKNRPMNVADEYMLLCSGPWLEAKGAVDEVKGGDEAGEITEQDRIVFLSNIMVVSYFASFTI